MIMQAITDNSNEDGLSSSGYRSDMDEFEWEEYLDTSGKQTDASMHAATIFI